MLPRPRAHRRPVAPHPALGTRFWPLTEEERAGLRQLFGHEQIRRLVTSLCSRDAAAGVEVLDAAYWMKGCSSLGRRRFAVRLNSGGEDGELCLVDVKEAAATDAPHDLHAAMPANHADRVVAGARHLSPALDEWMLAATLFGHPVFLRELLPQDLKFEIERLDLEEAVRVARYLAGVTGKAHARQMDPGSRRTWREKLHPFPNRLPTR